MNGRLSTVQTHSKTMHTQAALHRKSLRSSPNAAAAAAAADTHIPKRKLTEKTAHRPTFTDRYHQEGSLASDVVSIDASGKKKFEAYLRDRHDKLVTHITDDLMLLDPYPTQNQKTW